MTPLPAELLRAVIDAPDDDAPRRACADWYDGQHDPRAAFIRLQLRIAAAQRAGEPSARYRPWEEDAEELRREHGAAWAAEFSPPCTAVVFVRGMAEHLHLGVDEFLRDGQQLLAQAPVRHLDLQGKRIWAGRLFASPLLATVRSLRLDGFGLNDADLALLAASPHLGALAWLDLMRNNVGIAGARHLAASKRLPQLRYVGFFANRIDPTEEVCSDQGAIVSQALPPEGLALEAEFGRIRWLHFDDARSTRDIPPRRY